MNKKPGVEREQRISDDGLARLKNQLENGRNISQVVLDQWILRYGDEAENIIKKYSKNKN